MGFSIKYNILLYITYLYIAWLKTLQLRYLTRYLIQSIILLFTTALNKLFFYYRLLIISVFNSNNLLKPITDVLANNTYLKTPCSITLLSTSLFTTILSTKYTIVLFLEEGKAKSKIK